jgi:hypothetical protein
MTRWKKVVGSLAAVIALAFSPLAGTAVRASQAGSGGALSPAYLDQLLAPVALYPDALLAQVLLCSGNSRKVGELAAWLKRNPHLKGSELQQAVQDSGFEPSFVALAPFPQVVELMAGNLTWTSQLGGAFAVDRGAVFDSIQRLRKQSQAAGNLKSTPQQTVESRTVEGQQVIVIEPANPQVIYVPVYNPQVVYTQPAATTTTVVVVDDDDDDEAAVAGAVVGFAAGVAIGAAINNNYYYGPYGYRGGAYMYNSGWNDWYDDREDAREDFYENREDAREDYADHREDMAGERSDRAEDARENRSDRSENAQEQRTERTEQRGERSGEAQAQRTERTGERTGEAKSQAQAQRSERQQTRSTSGTSASTAQRSSGERTRATGERSGTRSDAFSNYSSGKSTRSASERGQRSRSGGGGGRRR